MLSIYFINFHPFQIFTFKLIYYDIYTFHTAFFNVKRKRKRTIYIYK